MADIKIFVWAGTQENALKEIESRIASGEIKDNNVAVPITNRLQLLGYRGGELWLCGTYKSHVDTTDIVTMARSREMTVVNKIDDGVDVKDVAKVGAMTMERKDGNINST